MTQGFIKKFIFLVCATVLGSVSNAQAVPGDYNADGLSDLSVALSVKASKYSAWMTRLSNSGDFKFWSWGLPADAYVSGRFYVGDANYYPGIVYVRSSSFPLEWYIKNAANTDVFVKFGLPGDTITNLGDWDGDGIDDIHVVRKDAGDFLNWYVSMSGSGGKIVQYVFGMSGDKVGVADVDGDGKAEMVALRSGFIWYIRKPSEETFTTVQWGLPGDIHLMPTDIDGDHLADYVITRRTGTTQLAYIRYGNGATQNTDLGFDSSIPQMGNFIGNLPTFAWSQRDTGWTAIRRFDGTPDVFKFGIASNAVIRADGTVVQPSEDGRFGGSSGGGVTPDPGSGGTASCSTTYGSGWLLKPAAQDTGGTRLGKPLILFTRNYPSSSCLNVIATNGEIVAKYGKFSSNRFYSGYGCGSHLSASQIAAKAVAASGSKNIYVQDPSSKACYGPGPADGRTDKR